MKVKDLFRQLHLVENDSDYEDEEPLDDIEQEEESTDSHTSFDNTQLIKPTKTQNMPQMTNDDMGKGISSSYIQSIIQREVSNAVSSKMRSIEKGKERKTETPADPAGHITPKSNGNRITPRGSSGSGITLPSGTHHKRGSKKKDRAKPNNKQKGREERFPFTFKEFFPINISPLRKQELVLLNTKSGGELLNRYINTFAVFSVCKGGRSINESMNYSLMLEKDLIVNDFGYIPTYTKDKEGKILGITFLIYCRRIDEKVEYKEFIRYIYYISKKFGINKYILYIKGKFLTISDGEVTGKLDTLQYQPVILYNFITNGNRFDKDTQVYLNPKPRTKEESESRKKKNELC